MINFFRRIYHFGLKLFLKLYPYPKPMLYTDQQGLEQWLESLNEKGEKKLLLVTDATLVSLGLVSPVAEAIKAKGIEVEIFDDVQPNPTIANVEAGLDLYLSQQCQAILAIGGGSVMDCAKLIGARVVKPNKSVAALKGLFKIFKQLPPLYAIPTTAGTGSETTIVAVISDPEKQVKYAVVDPVLAPTAAILLPEITKGLPPFITATTGMDALTHAIESYIGINNTPFTTQRSLSACKLIFDNLVNAHDNGEDLEARLAMLQGSFYAGEAFTRASVGYVHAIAHQLGAIYNTPHGLANAVIMPKVLRWYGEAAHQKLADISDFCGLVPTDQPMSKKALAVIEKIESFNAHMSIPTTLEEVQRADIDKIVLAALTEAHPDYPVPRFMDKQDCQGVVEALIA
ncbi:iron-containing alcohol dehydrogenase [Thalassotalea agarivorans]|uniref:Alcohol dehydrogenase, class IV n=1 Tax=Thalassotalea agarivorans TaxID=349064 RepID=A0A1I0H974_THASX|nr:iron-containing alcohol dehydrogenase [Thalassotalea agarivorans]SET80177.1 Alcohol dehydrogenase, class IV [Thalassotalea agarivorans]